MIQWLAIIQGFLFFSTANSINLVRPENIYFLNTQRVAFYIHSRVFIKIKKRQALKACP